MAFEGASGIATQPFLMFDNGSRGQELFTHAFEGCIWEIGDGVEMYIGER